MAEKKELIKIVGAKNVIDDPESLAAYSCDNSFVHSVRPKYVVKPKNADEVQALVKWANETLTPLVPVSSGPPHFRGDTVPSTGGAVIVDLSGMNKILRIDRRNRVAMVEPGVTFAKLEPELEKEGLRLNMPLLPRSSKSVTGFTREEEIDFGTINDIPFLLEESLTRSAARFNKVQPWHELVIVDERVITGQNPTSAHAVGAALVKLLS